MQRYYGSFDNLKNNIIIPFVVNIVTSAIAYFFTNNFVLVIIVLVVGLSLFFVFFWLINFVIYKRTSSVAIVDIIPFLNSKRPTDFISLDQRVRNIKNRFLFMGVSAKSIWNTELVNMMTSYKYQNCSFHFLLMDPNGKALARRMESEGVTSVSGAKHDIVAFITQLSELKSRAPKMNIKVKIYDFVPPFWLVLCDDTLYAQTFPKGGIGLDSPLLILQKEQPGQRGFFEPFLIFIDETWNFNSTEIDLNQDSFQQQGEKNV